MRIIIILLILLSTQLSIAEVAVDPVLSLCVPYPSIKSSDPIPTTFNTTNNLARSPESGFYQAEGNKIVIYARLMDAGCVPINDAKIYIWQANAHGYIQYKTKENVHQKWFDPNFDGTGIANSDNLGRFNFITIIPGSTKKTTPHINIKIEHPELDDFTSKIYIPVNGITKIHDKDLSAKINVNQVYAAPGKVDTDGIATEYFIDITLKQKIPHKEY